MMFLYIVVCHYNITCVEPINVQCPKPAIKRYPINLNLGFSFLDISSNILYRIIMAPLLYGCKTYKASFVIIKEVLL